MIPPHPQLPVGPIEVADLLLGALMVLGVHGDLKERRIPNTVNGGFMLAGLLVAAAAGGGAGLLSSLVGAGLGFALLFPFHALGGMGAGDVKFAMALGALGGGRFMVPGVLLAAVGMALQAGVQTLWVARRYGGFAGWALARKDELERRVPLAEQGTAVWVPYAVGISLGVLAARVSGWSPVVWGG